MRYMLLGASGLGVSELCLGTVTFGDDYGGTFDVIDRARARVPIAVPAPPSLGGRS
jgi:aryl-alcohol dehydrogenase-like predicted oxidoreductase